ncbi:MAG: hypothetical protein M3345_01465 [Actinomycetota bacterium]|nr:hypothetical protein [Actinomycetota bacterium]
MPYKTLAIAATFVAVALPVISASATSTTSVPAAPLVLATETPTASPSPSPSPCDDSWRQIHFDDPVVRNDLAGVTAPRPDEVWVVGDHQATQGGSTRTLVKRWDGQQWLLEQSPTYPDRSTSLNGVDEGRGAVVAVGRRSTRWSSRPWAMHRVEGVWRAMEFSDPVPASSFSAVGTLSGRRAWAVGTRQAGPEREHYVLIERWNGSTWRPTSVSVRGLLYGVHARRYDDVWAVGQTLRNGAVRTLTMHFNGRRWRIVPSPNESMGAHLLQGVYATASNDAWAVGYRKTATSGWQPFTMHWNGTAWRFIDVPNLEGDNSFLNAVSIHGGEVIAVGETYNQPLVVSWEAGVWQRLDMSSFRDQVRVLNDVEHAPNGAVFAVGWGGEVVLYRPPPCP